MRAAQKVVPEIRETGRLAWRRLRARRHEFVSVAPESSADVRPIGEGRGPGAGRDFARHAQEATAALDECGVSGRHAFDGKNDFDGAGQSIAGKASQWTIQRDHDVTGTNEGYLAGL